MVELKNVYPLLNKKFDTGLKCNESVPSIEDALNKLICKVNELGKMTNNVVNDWNNVMKWIMEDGTIQQIVLQELSSTELGKGASLIGINDSNSNFTSDTVEGALNELAESIKVLTK